MLFNYNDIPENPFDLIPARNGNKDIEKLQDLVDDLIQIEGFNPEIINDLMHKDYSFVEIPLMNGSAIFDREHEKNEDLVAKLEDFKTSVLNCDHLNRQRIERAVESLKILCRYQKTDPDIWKNLKPLPSKASKIIAYRIYLITEYIEHYHQEYKTQLNSVFQGTANEVKGKKHDNKYTKADIFRLISVMFKKICNKQYLSI